MRLRSRGIPQRNISSDGSARLLRAELKIVPEIS
jgi:hypothetical protein